MPSITRSIKFVRPSVRLFVHQLCLQLLCHTHQTVNVQSVIVESSGQVRLPLGILCASIELETVREIKLGITGDWEASIYKWSGITRKHSARTGFQHYLLMTRLFFSSYATSKPSAAWVATIGTFNHRYRWLQLTV